jgi:putative nucleotidyltransferase with HDIG domain
MKVTADDIISGDLTLVDRFKDIAPGSDKHCRNVSMLCESVGNVIEGINQKELVAAARVHDIGKMCNPTYFSENQEADSNVHDELDPPISYQYISRHVSDGVLKLIQINVDPIIIRIISEHHGDSVMSGIFAKAKSKYNGNTIEDHYRYKSCKPSMIESCILMICDVVESACRSVSNTEKEVDFKSTIERLINSLIDDEQLDVLTIGHIRVIKKILIKEIESIYHKRVSYKVDDDIEDTK